MSKPWKNGSLEPGMFLFYRSALLGECGQHGSYIKLLPAYKSEFLHAIANFEVTPRKRNEHRTSVYISSDARPARPEAWDKNVFHGYEPLVLFLGYNRHVSIFAFTEAVRQKVMAYKYQLDDNSHKHWLTFGSVLINQAQGERCEGPWSFDSNDDPKLVSSQTVDILIRKSTNFKDQAAFAEVLREFEANDPKGFRELFQMETCKEMHAEIEKKFGVPVDVNGYFRANFLVTNFKTDTVATFGLQTAPMAKGQLDDMVKSNFIPAEMTEGVFKNRKDFQALMEKLRLKYGDPLVK